MVQMKNKIKCLVYGRFCNETSKIFTWYAYFSHKMQIMSKLASVKVRSIKIKTWTDEDHKHLFGQNVTV